jgi:hypothetical protein
MQTNKHIQSAPLLVWDTCDIASRQSKHLVEIGEVDNEEKGFELACQDSDLLTFEWESLTECLTETLNSFNSEGHWRADVENFGWLNQQGYTEFEADNGSDFLNNILPETDCTFRLFLEDERILIQNFHHDSPAGNEWYTIQPISTESA